MTKELSPVPLSEFSNNLISYFEKVIHDSKEIVVENDKGEQAVLKPVRPSKRKRRVRTEADHQAFLASAGGWKDEDIDQFLKNNEESRNLNTRPPVDL